MSDLIHRPEDIVAKLDDWLPHLNEPPMPWDHTELPTSLLLEVRSEIDRLRARVAKLERVREAAEAWRADMALPVDHIRTGKIGCMLIDALEEAKP